LVVWAGESAVYIVRGRAAKSLKARSFLVMLSGERREIKSRGEGEFGKGKERGSHVVGWERTGKVRVDGSVRQQF